MTDDNDDECLPILDDIIGRTTASAPIKLPQFEPSNRRNTPILKEEEDLDEF